MEKLTKNKPALAAIEATRKSVFKPKGRTSTSSATSSAATSVSFSDRKSQFDWVEEVKTVNGFLLECMYCAERVVNNKQRLTDHEHSKKHLDNMEADGKRRVKRMNIHQQFQQFEGSIGDLHSNANRKATRRIEVLRVFLLTGTPIERISAFEPILCESQPALCSPSHMMEHVPFLHKEQRDLVKTRLQSCKTFSVIFDGTCRLGEAFAVVARVVTEAFEIQHILIRFVTVAKSMTGVEIASILMSVLIDEYGVKTSSVTAFVRDRAAANNVAIANLKMLFKDAVDVPCFAHTINNAGDAAVTPYLLQFSQHLASLFSHSPANKLFWKSFTGLPQLPSVSDTRWWSRFELYVKVLEHWPDIIKLVLHDDFSESSPATRNKLRVLIHEHGHRIRIELAAVVDAGRMFAQATYVLEGDGELITKLYDIIEPIRLYITEPTFRNVNSILATTSPLPADQHALRLYALECVKPMFSYFTSKITDFDAPLRPMLDLCQAARVFDPDRMLGLDENTQLVRERFQGFVQSSTLDAMAEQRIQYLHLANEYKCSQMGGTLTWWSKHGRQIPAWREAALRIFSLAPSSAAVERVFSASNSMFNDLQSSALADLIETALMLRCNDASQ
jgi:hypothetical protein